MSKFLFVCYALERSRVSELRERLDRITRGARLAGYDAYAHVRDTQNWHFEDDDLREVLDFVFRRIRESDAVLLDLTAETPGYKRVGLNIECGFAKALGKPIAAVWRQPDRPDMTTDLADCEQPYGHLTELEDATSTVLNRLEARLGRVAHADSWRSR